MTTDKPSRNEDEYFVKQEAELLRKQRAQSRGRRARRRAEVPLMKCPKDGYDLASSTLSRRADRDLPPLRRDVAGCRRGRGRVATRSGPACSPGCYRTRSQPRPPRRRVARDQLHRGGRRDRGQLLPRRASGHARGRARAQPERARVRPHRRDARAGRRRSPSSASSPRSGRSTARYKHSKPVLKTFPTTGPQVVQGPGENAGVLRLPDGWAVAFKIESHNHPSAVEPYQGAATGVGGILRDVFTMGARPVAVLNSLRFGPLDHAPEPLPLRRRRARRGRLRQLRRRADARRRGGLRRRATPGIRSSTPCASACSREDDLIRAAAHGVGNVLLCVGARTGRDGIHGASFASEELSREERGAAAPGPGGRSVHREAAARGQPRAHHVGTHRRDPGHGRGRAHQLVAPRWRRAAASAWRSTPGWCPPASRA